ncbi:MAG: glutaminyl-tRNA synthetase [Pseudomonadota bacterium]|nr:glutaminyl-tRNA synthetase [Pseudomonadota bacterium]
MSLEAEKNPNHFIAHMIEEDLQNGKYASLNTRFPPEPNGYLHIGHAKSICLNFGLAERYQGQCFMRFDDTNPLTEEQEYIDAILEDVLWLGYQWCAITHSSDYYEFLYERALELIDKGLAYVDASTADEIKNTRGTLQEPGKNSPYRDRLIAENRDLFERMRKGEFADGQLVLRAKIDMSSPNINMRDPVLYRIRHVPHPRTGNDWCIYPMYDYAHPLCDAIEKITHSLCTLEFQDHRPLYDWFIANTTVPAKPEQTEFSRLNVSHTVTSKRKLRQLVEEGHVDGWDDPRLPTIRGMRKRGYPPESLRKFSEVVGISRSDSIIDMSILEECVRESLNAKSLRYMVVEDPIKVVIKNFPEEDILRMATLNNQDPNAPTRPLHLTKEVFIERSDFMQDPPKDFYRLAPGKEVRLRHNFIIRCDEVELDDKGQVKLIYATADLDTLGQNPVGRKVKGVIHWVSAKHYLPLEVTLYDRLFNHENPAALDNFTDYLNPHSQSKKHAVAEMGLTDLPLNSVVQFERVGYFKKLSNDHFSRVVDLKSTWEKFKKG